MQSNIDSEKAKHNEIYLIMKKNCKKVAIKDGLFSFSVLTKKFQAKKC